MNAQNIPAELMSHILSFRPRHPLAQILLDFKEQVMAETLMDCANEEEEHIFEKSLHKCISYTQEGELFWKNTLGDGDPWRYCWRVRWDYDAVYNGDWNYGCERQLGFYHDPTQPPPPLFVYTHGDDAEQQTWRVQWRRLTGDALCILGFYLYHYIF